MNQTITTIIRPATESDAAELDRFYARLSPESLYMRFFSASPDAYRRVPPDPTHRFSLLAATADDGEVVGVAEYIRSASHPTRAEVAFVVLDRMQHHGLATSMLHELSAIARSRGIHVFTAHVLLTNNAMMHVFQRSGLELEEDLLDGIVKVTLSLDSLDSRDCAELMSDHNSPISPPRPPSPPSIALTK